MRSAVILFARLPEKGKVKTRLAKTLGDNFAVKFYNICAQHAFGECRKTASGDTAIYIFYPDIINEESIKNWAGKDFRAFPQSGENIGIRMLNAFKTVFAEGIERAVLIGTDIPDISSTIIFNALTSLEKSEVVIGPAKDGGYYLIGMKKTIGLLFEEIEWETGKVFENTLSRIIINNIKSEIISGLYDIDTEEDLKEWMSVGNELSNNPVRDFVKENYSPVRVLG
jgi:rSAM/selenodomain-associated transferase 1